MCGGGGTLAGSLFKTLEGVSASQKEEGPRESISVRSSKIASLMANFHHAPVLKSSGGDWDGWEQVGSRWLRKNPMTPEEIAAAASFYGSTRRHAKEGRRLSDGSAPTRAQQSGGVGGFSSEHPLSHSDESNTLQQQAYDVL